MKFSIVGTVTVWMEVQCQCTGVVGLRWPLGRSSVAVVCCCSFTDVYSSIIRWWTVLPALTYRHNVCVMKTSQLHDLMWRVSPPLIDRPLFASMRLHFWESPTPPNPRRADGESTSDLFLPVRSHLISTSGADNECPPLSTVRHQPHPFISVL